MLTLVILHGDATHLIFNVITFYSFARGIELLYSPIHLFLSFVLSTLGGSLYSFYKNRNNPDYLAVGASGGVTGVLYSSIFLLQGGSIRLLLLPIPIPANVYAILFILYSYYRMKRGNDNIGHDAHIGGAVTGTLFAIVLYPWIILVEFWTILAMFLPFLALHFYDKWKR